MKKFNISYIQVVVFVFTLIVFSDPALCHKILTENEQAYLRQKKTIVFVSQTTYPPFEFVAEQGDHTGMCIELARWMATELGFKAQFTDTSFQQAQQAVLSGKADVLTSFFYSEKRDKLFEFTDMFFPVPASIFVAFDRPDIKSIDDLNNKTIAMQKGDYALEFLKSKNVSFKVAYTSNFDQATDLVINGQADAIIGDEQIVLYHIYSMNLTDRIKKVGEPLYVGENCMSVKEGNILLQSILNKGLKNAREKGVWDGINQKWLGVHYSEKESFLIKYGFFILFLLAGLSLTTFLVWFWNVSLRKEVSVKTEKLARSEILYRSLFENANDAFFIYDLEGKFLDANPQSCKRFGYTRQEMLKMNTTDIDTPAYAKKFPERFSQIKGLGMTIFETVNISKIGNIIPTEINAQIITYKGQQAVLNIARDITERKQMEELLRIQRDLGMAIGSTSGLKNALDVCLEAALKVPGIDCGGIYLVDPEDETISLIVHKGLPKEFVDIASYFEAQSPQVKIIAKGKSIFLSYKKVMRALKIEKNDMETWIKADLKAIGIVPINHEGNIIGALNVGSKNHNSIPEFARYSMEAIATQMAGALAKIRSDQALKVSEDRLLAAIDAIDEGFIMFDAQDRLIMYNAKYMEIFNKTSHLLKIGKRFEDLVRESVKLEFPEAIGREKEWIANTIHNHTIADSSIEHKLYNGRWIKISDRKTKDGSTVGFRVDITKIKESEKRSQAALREKEVLLKEIHHRVKNNMQVISSLLSLQANKIADKRVSDAFEQAKARVHSMSLVHEILYQSDNLSEIPFQKYLETLAAELIQSFIVHGKQVNIKISAENIILGIEQAIPCGLIVTELLTNALKYAFPSKTPGTIKIKTSLLKNRIVMVISDNGIGLPPDFNPRNINTLGVRLVTDLVLEQLEGSWTLDKDQGVCWNISWPID